MTEIDWASEIGAHADEAALEAELAASLDAEGSALTNRNAFSSFWGVVKRVVLAPILALEGLMIAVVPQGFLRYSTGAWLDEKLKEFGKTRKAAVKAQGNVTFSRTGSSGNVNIPAGTIISSLTLADGTVKRVVSLSDTVLPDGATTVDVLCQAEQEGAAYNLAAGAYTELAAPVAGIEAVTNGASWLVTAGVDAEIDDAARQRVFDDQAAGGEGWIGGGATYLSIANNFSGVVDAVVDGAQPRGQGSVDVIIIGGAGQPTQQLIDDLTAEYATQGQPPTDNLLVRGPTDITVNVDVDAVVLNSDTRIDAAIQTAVEALLDSLFTYGTGSNYLNVGQDYVLGAVAKLAIEQESLKTLRFTAPGADVAIATGELAVAGTRSVTVVREDP